MCLPSLEVNPRVFTPTRAKRYKNNNQNIQTYVGNNRERKIKMLENEQANGSSLYVNNSKTMEEFPSKYTQTQITQSQTHKHT